jgi:hypothetical protein
MSVGGPTTLTDEAALWNPEHYAAERRARAEAEAAAAAAAAAPPPAAPPPAGE